MKRTSMKVSFVATVFNEEGTIESFLNSIFAQSKLPDEIIIVDGGSSDRTVAKIKSQRSKVKNFNGRFLIFSKKGNRSVGRNEAIKIAGNEIIVCSDAGCTLDKDWLKNIIEPFRDSRVDVVAGYYKGIAKTIFQKCLIPYALVMPDKINEGNFLPATRSMALKKAIWKKTGGFDEKYSHNEDYVFAHKLKDIGARITFQKKAIVNWTPLGKIKDAFRMFFRFAFGDSESGILREKILLLYARYLLFFYFLLLSFIGKSTTPLYAVIFGLLMYIVWSIKKNYRYVRDVRAFFFLPLMQFTSDFAVISGTGLGLLKRIKFEKLYSIIGNNRWIALVIGLYAALMLLLINWGIPNPNHPFNYFMDEWHQAQAVRSVFTQGSPNVPGSANGSMFHFLLSGLSLVPFIATGMVNPFAISSSVDALEMQQRLFQILRLNTLFFGISSIILISYIAKKYFKLSTFFVGMLFVINPIWMTLSNYFKYDIALIFWIILSILFSLRYSAKPTFTNFSIAAFIFGLTLSIKVSALPLLPILLVSYVFFTKKIKDNIKHLAAGVFIFFLTFLIFGVPDLLLGNGDINEYLYDNLVRTPNFASNYILGMPYWAYGVINGIPTVFGISLSLISLFGLLFLMINVFKKPINPEGKLHVYIFTSLIIFILSLVFLRIEARGNRLLVLLPFMVLVSGIFMNKILKSTKGYLKIIITLVLIILFSFQAVESFAWVNLKLKSDLREMSSVWIGSNIPLRTTVGIENIPIYQSLPGVILKDYYLSKNPDFKYNYEIIDSLDKELPTYVIVTNGEAAKNYTVKSFKKDLINYLEEKKYRKIYYVRQESQLFSFFRSKLDYFMSGLIQEPLSISLYKYP